METKHRIQSMKWPLMACNDQLLYLNLYLLYSTVLYLPLSSMRSLINFFRSTSSCASHSSANLTRSASLSKTSIFFVRMSSE